MFISDLKLFDSKKTISKRTILNANFKKNTDFLIHSFSSSTFYWFAVFIL